MQALECCQKNNRLCLENKQKWQEVTRDLFCCQKNFARNEHQKTFVRKKRFVNLIVMTQTGIMKNSNFLSTTNFQKEAKSELFQKDAHNWRMKQYIEYEMK